MVRWGKFGSSVLASICVAVALFPTDVLAFDDTITASRLENSVFRDAWHAILSEADLEPEMVDMAHEKRRQMFVQGDLILDCCSVKIWRERPEEKAVQLWSKPFFYTVDHLILQEGRQYDLGSPTKLQAYRVGVVHGFTYPSEESFGVRVERTTLAEVFDAIARGEADLTIANHQEFRRQQKLKHRPLVLGPEHQRLFLRARVHKSRPDLLVRIDEAIEKLQSSGQIALLTGQRLRGK